MKVIPAELPGLIIIEPAVFVDERGFFMETWKKEYYASSGLPSVFVQDNLSFSKKGVLRGLHFQYPDLQGKLVYVLQGEVFDVAVDIRQSSLTFGKWFGIFLSAFNKRQLFIPEGFAHGFCVTSESALVAYKCTNSYKPQTQYGIHWDDKKIGIGWPITNPILSEKDKSLPTLNELSVDFLPDYRSTQP